MDECAIVESGQPVDSAKFTGSREDCIDWMEFQVQMNGMNVDNLDMVYIATDRLASFVLFPMV